MSFNSFGAKIKVVGVGGGGGNAVNTMIRSGLEGVDFIVANTDAQALKASLAPHKIQLGKELTKGLGAGADPDIGRDAALEDRMELQEFLSDADMVFITAGMGGGTGTGAAAVVAQIARELGALTVAVVTKPFSFEGKRRRKHAELGVARLRECVDTLITIPNQRLLQVATPDLSMLDAFKLADNVLVNAVRGISDIINTPGLINVDFADVKTVMSSMGHALMGIGYGTGADRALSAAKQAVSSPLLEDLDIEGATGILINITAGTNVSIMEVNNACMIIQEAAHEDANIIFGAVIDEALGDEIRITVIATGFPVEESLQPEEVSPTFATRVNPTVKPLQNQGTQRLVAPPRLTTPVSAPNRERVPAAVTPVATEQNLSRPSPATPTTHAQQPAASQPVAAKTAEPVRQTAVNNWAPTVNGLPQNPAQPQRAAAVAEPMAVARSHESLVSQASVWANEQKATVAPPQPRAPQASIIQEVVRQELIIEQAHDKDAAEWFATDSTEAESALNHAEALDPAWDLTFGEDSTDNALNIASDVTHPSLEETLAESVSIETQNTNLPHDSFGLDDVASFAPTGKTVAEMVFATNEADELRAGAVRGEDESAWDFDPPNPTLVSDEIDRRIDEALALAGQMGGVENNVAMQHPQSPATSLDLDDLELPAFLRSNTDTNSL
jgi:cell division protein FtsZ